MLNGRITGYGEYYSPIGDEVLKGSFVNGILTDGDGYHKNQAGEVYEGVSEWLRIHAYLHYVVYTVGYTIL